jgi:hypothetical protein
MLTIALLFVKNALNGALRLFLAHWRVLIPLLIVAYGLYQFNALYKAKNDAINELASFKQAIAIKVREQEIENAIKLQIAKKEVEQSEQTYARQIEVIKNVYEKRTKTDVNTIADLRNRLREQIASDTFTMPDPYTNSERTAQEWQNSYATIVGQYQNLIDACSITTSDYNLLRDWADTSCNQIGCQ